MLIKISMRDGNSGWYLVLALNSGWSILCASMKTKSVRVSAMSFEENYRYGYMTFLSSDTTRHICLVNQVLESLEEVLDSGKLAPRTA